MGYFLFLIKAVIYAAVGALQLAMLARAILSWIPNSFERLEDFLFTVTEPFIVPVRMVLERFEAIENLPIDVSFFVTFVLLAVIQGILGAFL